MKKSLLFDFSVDKTNKTVHIKREFDASLRLVWQAWTTAELLNQWWAPKPYRIETKTLDFREGGRWHYAMVSPENEKHWCCFDYEMIRELKGFTGWDAFCDEEGTLNANFSRMYWENLFSESADRTEVNITISVDTLETLEKIIAMGFKEGFTMGLQQLDELLAASDS